MTIDGNGTFQDHDLVLEYDWSKLLIRHLLLLVLTFSFSFYILEFSGPQSFLVTMIAGGILGYSYGIVEKRQLANPGVFKSHISHLFDHYLEKFYLGNRVVFLICWIFWMYIVKESEPTINILNLLLEGFFFVLIANPFLYYFFIFPLKILLKIADDLNTPVPQTTMPPNQGTLQQQMSESSGVVKGKSTVISIIFLPFKILMSFFWFFAYFFTFTGLLSRGNGEER